MFSRAGVVIAAVIAVAWTAGSLRATTQTPQESSALITEMRMMRQSIDAMASNHLRVQLVFARLQAQQMPLSRASGMLQIARSQLASFTVRYDDMSDRISELEAMANDATRPAEEVEKLQREARMVRAEAARLENQRSSLLVAEADAARQHAEEQAKLDALIAQIEDLERTLPPPRRP